MVDPVVVREFNDAVRTANRQGRALVEVLESRGLLATPHLEHDLVYRELSALLAQVRQRGPAVLMRRRWGRVHGSPTEMFMALEDFMQSYVDSRQM